MLPNAFLATLSGSLAQNGSETEVFLSNITTLTGETVTTAIFSVLGRGVITVDPLVSSNIEFISFTGVDASGIGFTGITRGLSALSNSVVTANKKYHPVGAQVIIAFGNHNLLDLKAYIDGAVAGSVSTASDTSAGTVKTSVNMGAVARTRSTLVSQQSSPNMTLVVQPFSYVNGNTTITFVGGNTGTMVAPVSNSRYDLIVYRPSGSAVAIVTGTEAASPSLPTPLNGDIVLASILHRVGETTILDRNVSPNTQGYIASWYEPTAYMTGTNLINSQTTFGNDQTQATQNGSITVGESNATTKHSLIAQKFFPTTTGIQGVKLWKAADTGSFIGSVKISLQADSSGSPSGVDLASYTISNVAWLKLTAANEIAISFSTEYESASIGSAYWFVVAPSTSDNSNHPNLGINTAGGYAAGALKFNNSTDGWVLVATSMLYFKETTGVLGKVVQTDLTSGLIPVNTRPYSLLSNDQSSTSITASTTETQLYKTLIEGGFWTANSGLRARAFFTFNAASTSVFSTLRLKYNGTSFGSIATPTGSNTGWDQFALVLEFFVIGNNSTSSQNVIASLQIIPTHFGGGTLAITSLIMNVTPTLTTSAIDLTQPGLLEITAQNSAGGSVTTSYFGSIIEKIG